MANHTKRPSPATSSPPRQTREPTHLLSSASRAAAPPHGSEAERLASRRGRGVTLLTGDWDRVLDDLVSLGQVKMVTRNRSAMIERDGFYPRMERLAAGGQFCGEATDLRLLLGPWTFLFAVEKPAREPGGLTRRSLQFFDKHGDALHKTLLSSSSPVKVYEDLANDLRAPESTRVVAEPPPSDSSRQELGSEDRSSFLTDWARLEEVHDFTNLLKRFRLERPTAFRIAERRFTRKVSNRAAESLLGHAARTRIPLRIFTQNRGCLQVHKGEVGTFASQQDWAGTMAQGTAFHLKPSDIASSWVVKKPTRDGMVVSLEIFDRVGREIARFFCLHNEGRWSREWLRWSTNLP